MKILSNISPARIIVMLGVFFTTSMMVAQVNQFEKPKNNTEFNKVDVKIGGAFALQYQALDHENNAASLINIGNNFNLATADLDINAHLGDGLTLHLRTYLSSRHHRETWVKGGYLQIDKLSFISPDFGKEFMENVTFKIGHMEINYGDQHFRRTDNAHALNNAFVGNSILDAFTTEVGMEMLYRKNAYLMMLGITNGKLNQGPTNPGATSPSLVGKFGFDKQVNDDLRTRFTGSFYHTAHSARTYLYAGDRTGSRYYGVIEESTDLTANYKSGRFDPGFKNELTAIMFNPFMKYKGLEFFGIYEITKGKANAETETRTWNHSLAEVLYRFGGNEQLYFGARYNKAKGALEVGGEDVSIKRSSVVAGWFLTDNIVTKLEYVNQKYAGFGDKYAGAKFNGFMFEAVISF